MASANDLASKASVALCRLCWNFNYDSAFRGEYPDWPDLRNVRVVSLVRTLSEFDESAKQGCSTCWVIASIGRLWDHLMDPDTQISVRIFANGDPEVSSCEYTPLRVYRPKGASSCETRRTRLLISR